MSNVTFVTRTQIGEMVYEEGQVAALTARLEAYVLDRKLAVSGGNLPDADVVEVDFPRAPSEEPAPESTKVEGTENGGGEEDNGGGTENGGGEEDNGGGTENGGGEEDNGGGTDDARAGAPSGEGTGDSPATGSQAQPAQSRSERKAAKRS